ncbi:MAG: 3-oxoacyl-ACP synthase [Candidatus Melainabacteria bacterium]|nr:MAG: 3-oxoacyl-ACP synthase [Candidatus Melainabacteria bacterium]
MAEAYIVGTGSYLPGPPIGNDQIEDVLGFVEEKSSRLKSRILKSNGIRSRHYALDRKQRSTHQNSELASMAAENCLMRLGFDRKKIDMLAVASTQGDLPLPGMASMVQAQMNLPPCEILTTHGVCSAGMMALKSGVNQVRLAEKKNVLVVASELASRLLKRSRYEAASQTVLDLEAEFLRWMLSDGSGALLVQSEPAASGLSLKVEWIEIISFASDFDLCMSCGTADQSLWSTLAPEKEPELSLAAVGARQAERTVLQKRSHENGERSWQDYATYAEAEAAGALLIRQNLRILDNIVKVGVDGFLRLIQAGKISADEVDHFVCHYSSHYFRGKILELFKMCGCLIPEEKWFTNLYTKGNTGCASAFIALDELFWSGRLQTGQVIFCVVPESGRFTTAYMKLTVV